jgi:hypothetical protein
MARRLSEEEYARLCRRREQLRLELRMVEAELRSEEALRLKELERAHAREVERPRLGGRWREWTGPRGR